MFDKGLLTLTDIKKTMRGLVGLYILQAFLIVGQAVSLGSGPEMPAGAARAAGAAI